MSILSKTASVAQGSGGRPRTAVELTPEGALAATLPAPGQGPVYAYAALPAGSLAPGVAEPNIKTADGVTAAIRSALDQVSPKSKAVTLVVPDTAARVFVLDFDSLPAKQAESIPVLRFRLRKMVPFDMEHAALSYQVMVQEKGGIKVLATVMPGPILAEYEAAVRGAGYEPGAVLPSSLAALAALESMEPVLVANLSGVALTTSITSEQDLLLYRTIELPMDAAGRLAEVQRSIAVAGAYYEDKIAARAQTLHYAGTVRADEFAELMGDPELKVVEMSPHPDLGMTTSMRAVSFAGITGALTGVG